eukprot:COSAG06_NODE_7221_length_2582_cov_1.709223_5_plen_171_part_00
MESRCAVRDFAVRRHLRLPRRITVTAGGGSSGAHRSVVVPFQRRCGWCRRRSRTGWHLYVGPTAWCFSMQQRVKPLRATASRSGVQYPLPNLELDLNLSGTALPVRSGAPAGLQTRAAARPTAARPTALWQGSWTPRRMRSAASLWAVLETISSTRRKTWTRRHACVLLS